MRKYKTCVAIIMVLATILSVCACNSKNTDEAKVVCFSFCDAVRAGDTAKLAKYFNDPSMAEAALSGLNAVQDMNSEQAEYYEVIRNSLIYSVEEPVYNAKDNTATVVTVWCVGNYDSDAARAAKNINDFKDAIAFDPKTLTASITVDMSGDLPVVVNPGEVIDIIYDFTSFDPNIMPGLLSDYYTDGDLVLAPKGVYTNTDSIGVRLNFSRELQNYRFIPGVIYSVVRGKEAVYTSNPVALEDDSIRLDLTTEMVDPSFVNRDGFLLAGDYTIFVFDEHSNDIASFECTVENKDIEKDEISFEDYKKDYYLSNLVYEVKDNDIITHTYVYNTGWWDYDGTSVGKSAFGSNTKTLGFSLAVSKDNDKELFYEYYYSEESDFSGMGDKPVFMSSCKPTVYDDQACYDLDYTPADSLKPGFYGLVVYSDASKKHVLFTAACMVVEETSGDVSD